MLVWKTKYLENMDWSIAYPLEQNGHVFPMYLVVLSTPCYDWAYTKRYIYIYVWVLFVCLWCLKRRSLVMWNMASVCLISDPSAGGESIWRVLLEGGTGGRCGRALPVPMPIKAAWSCPHIVLSPRCIIMCKNNFYHVKC
jgi:hypothetical protein